MLVAALIPIVATALGTALALGARRWLWVFEPARSFALAAVTVTIAVHLVPEAIDEAGPWALVVVAGGLVLPSLLGRVGGRLARGGHTRLALELSYVGVLAHQVGDGLGLGAVTGPMHAGHGHWDFLIAIGAHTVPLAAVVAFGFATNGDRRGAILRAAGVALAPLIGLAITRAGDAEATEAWAPWLNAAVSGLLLHVLAHDLPSAAGRTTRVKTAELVAVIAGVALPLLAAHEHAHEGGEHAAAVPAALEELALASAPALLLGVLLGAAMSQWARRARLEPRWIAASHADGAGAALRGATIGLPVPECACAVEDQAKEARGRGAGDRFIAAFVLAAPQLGLASVLLTAVLLGPGLAAVRVVAAIAMAVIAALVVRRKPGTRPHHHHDHDHTHRHEHGTHARWLDDVDALLAHDGSWITVGLVLAAYVAVALPGAPLAAWPPWGTLAVITLIALPVHLSATAATPIALALVGAGASPGVAVAALLVGTSLDIAKVAHLRREIGGAAATLVVVVAVAVTWAVALTVDAVDLAVDPIALDQRSVAIAALLALCTLGAASLWRHGLAHWLAALRGHDHGHQHDHGHEHEH